MSSEVSIMRAALGCAVGAGLLHVGAGFVGALAGYDALAIAELIGALVAFPLTVALGRGSRAAACALLALSAAAIAWRAAILALLPWAVILIAASALLALGIARGARVLFSWHTQQRRYDAWHRTIPSTLDPAPLRGLVSAAPGDAARAPPVPIAIVWGQFGALEPGASRCHHCPAARILSAARTPRMER